MSPIEDSETVLNQMTGLSVATKGAFNIKDYYDMPYSETCRIANSYKNNLDEINDEMEKQLKRKA